MNYFTQALVDVRVRCRSAPLLNTVPTGLVSWCQALRRLHSTHPRSVESPPHHFAHRLSQESVNRSRPTKLNIRQHGTSFRKAPNLWGTTSAVGYHEWLLAQARNNGVLSHPALWHLNCSRKLSDRRDHTASTRR